MSSLSFFLPSLCLDLIHDCMENPEAVRERLYADTPPSPQRAATMQQAQTLHEFLLNKKLTTKQLPAAMQQLQQQQEGMVLDEAAQAKLLQQGNTLTLLSGQVVNFSETAQEALQRLKAQPQPPADLSPSLRRSGGGFSPRSTRSPRSAAGPVSRREEKQAAAAAAADEGGEEGPQSQLMRGGMQASFRWGASIR